MRRHTLFRGCLFLLLSLAAEPLLRAQIPVEFTAQPELNTTLSSARRGEYLYGSLNDVARVFRLGTFENVESRKFEIKIGAFRVKATADNPYIVVRDEDLNSSVYQLPTEVLRIDGEYFVPMAQFSVIIDYILQEEVSWDRAGRRLLVGGRPRVYSPYELADLGFEEKTNGYMIRLRCTKRISDYESFTKEIGNDTWLYVTLANTRADVRRITSLSPPGILKKILVFQSATSVQLTFRITGKVSTVELLPAEGSDDILVAIHTPTPEEVAARATHNYDETLERERERWKLDVVVIDPGHGGDDPGTIGISRVREKDIVLPIAKKLGNLIRRNLPGVKVVYTRERDEFVELYRRGQIANENNGKLFISIHCNSMPRKPHSTNGFEIYLLRPGKTEAALRVAEKENAVVKMEEGYEKRYKDLTEENFILLTMAQSAYAQFSEKFAEILQQEMGKRLSLENNGVRQAGFYVLVGASMPNVLVETGYLSNRNDERFLKSGRGQTEIAEALFNAVKRYKSEYEKTTGTGGGNR